jgi:hypothetical protein
VSTLELEEVVPADGLVPAGQQLPRLREVAMGAATTIVGVLLFQELR